MKTPANHSPLLWCVAHTKHLEPFIVNATGKLTIANSVNGETMEVAEANAQYIVRACNAFPALVEALDDIVDFVSKHDNPRTVDELKRSIIEWAESALALARGEKGGE